MKPLDPCPDHDSRRAVGGGGHRHPLGRSSGGADGGVFAVNHLDAM